MRRPLAATITLLVALSASHSRADDSVTPEQQPATLSAATQPTTPPTTQPAPSRAPSEPHDAVMWRLTLGGAYAYGWSASNGMSRTVSAFPSIVLTSSLGHAVARNFVVHMDLSWTRSGAASYSSEGETIADDVSLTAMLAGIGATYWIDPFDVFVSGGLALGQISTVSGAYRVVIEIPDIESTDVGVGGYLAVGKQWRAGRKWGIGPEFRLGFLGAAQDFGDANPIKLLTITLSVSVTYD